MKKFIKKNFSFLLFLYGFGVLSMLYGIYAARFNLFPYNFIMKSNEIIMQWKVGDWFYRKSNVKKQITIFKSEKVAPGLTKVVDVEGDRSLAVKVINSQGEILQHWHIDWKQVWPESPKNIPDSEIPKTRPGTHIDGAEILENGDLVFNFEHLALVRMDPCGNVIWKLPIRSHHSIFVDELQNLWVSAQINHYEPLEKFPFFIPPIIEPVILKVSPEGKVMDQRSVFDLLIKNQQQGLLYTTSVRNEAPLVSGDIFHLNDVELFPVSKNSGFFKPHDVLISLRNVNTVFVFDSKWRLKYKWSNEFVRQHDPDFIDGNHISLIDNNNILFRESGAQSRVLIKTVDNSELSLAFTGSKEQPFYTDIMGKHQWLKNGNLLISESRYGRALEITPQGEVVWEFNNLVGPSLIALLEEVERLPELYDANFFRKARKRCENSNHRQHMNKN